MKQQFKQPGVYITEGPQDWQVSQRGPDGTAEISLSGVWRPDQLPCTVEVRVVREDTGRPPCQACDWHDAETTGDEWKITLKGVPTGGLYMIDTRLRQEGDPWRLTGDKVFHLAVGDLWAIAGQSNAAGYGHGPVEDPPCLCVHMFGADLKWKLATHPIHDTTRTKHPVNRDSGWVDHSPWLAFGRQVYRATGVPVGLLPTALGGSPLNAWDPGAESPVLYANMMDVIKKAGGGIAGMAWYQGESDAGPELAPTYAERFTRFINTMRKQLGAPDLPVLTAQLNRVEGNFDPLRERWWGVVREAQRQLAKTVPNVAVLPTLDLSLSDMVHLSSVGSVLLGERFAKAALALAYGRKVDYLAPDLARAAFVDHRQTVALEFDNVRGWLTAHRTPIPEFIVEDADGEVPLAEVAVDGSRVILKLAREPRGNACVHGALSPNPQISLMDEDQRPVLGFCDVPIAGSGAPD